MTNGSDVALSISKPEKRCADCVVNESMLLAQIFCLYSLISRGWKNKCYISRLAVSSFISPELKSGEDDAGRTKKGSSLELTLAQLYSRFT